MTVLKLMPFCPSPTSFWSIARPQAFHRTASLSTTYAEAFRARINGWSKPLAYYGTSTVPTEKYERSLTPIAPLAKASRTGFQGLDTLTHARTLNQTTQAPPLITSFQHLEYESDVNGKRVEGRARLVDTADHFWDYSLWAELLAFRSRINGAGGTKEIWHGMRARNIDIPTNSDDTSRFFWTSFLSVGLEEQVFLEEIWHYAQDLYQREGERWDSIFVEVLAYMLRREPYKVHEWYSRMQDFKLKGQGQMTELVEAATTSTESLNAFKPIYVESGDRNIYNLLISKLCEHERYSVAVAWHYLLLSKKDIPSSSTAADPLRRYLATLKGQQQAKDFTQSLLDAGVPFAASLQPKYKKPEPAMSRESASRLIGITFGIQPKPISDSLAARIFATEAFSLDLAIIALGAFGMETLGPLAMRELAARCHTSQEIFSRIKQCKDSRIQLHQCRYVQLIERLARDDNWPVLRSILASDQHPEVFEDRDTQKRLLMVSIRNQDWTQAQMTLVILTAFEDDAIESRWNQALLSCMWARNFEMTNRIVDNMHSLGVTVFPSTIRRSFHLLLRKRNPGNRPLSSPIDFDDLSFITNMWMKVLRAGGDVPAAAWKQVQIYLGMEGRLGELERLFIWLALFYSPQTSQTVRRKLAARGSWAYGFNRPSAIEAREYQPLDERNPLRQIFTTQRQSAIIQWGFKSLGVELPKRSRPKGFADAAVHSMSSEQHRRSDWARGVILLRRLSRLGIRVHPWTVRSACKQRLLTLFGPGKSRKRENRFAREKNTQSLVEMVQRLNRIWRPNLFPSALHGERLVKIALFGDRLRRPLVRYPLRLRHQLRHQSHRNRLFRGRNVCWT